MPAQGPVEVTIDKLVHGGQGIGTLSDGKKALVWNVLPGETVKFTPKKSRSSYVEGVAEEILKASGEREAPKDELYLSTSPWQMMKYDSENKYKQEILAETISRAGVKFDGTIGFEAPEEPWHYRGKMEYSFWGDEDGLHLALFNRGTHQKQIVTGSSIAQKEIDETANKICEILNSRGVRAGDFKSLIVRTNKAGESVAALFTRNEELPEFEELAGVCKGVAVYFSNPKSPASVLTRELYTYGDINLTEKLLGKDISYDVVSFFQVNVDIYEKVLEKIKSLVGENEVTDMYAGSGSIGLTVASGPLKLVELDQHSVMQAHANAKNSHLTDVEVVHAASENSVEYIPSGEGKTVIFDPPRAGLHLKVTEATLQILPEQIIYLSCNPSTLARDLDMLSDAYDIQTIDGYNFFPKTPHIEALAVLKLKPGTEN